jgi:PilZ domain
MPDEAGFGRRTDGPTGRRRALRERMNLPVSLYSVEQSRVSLLADVSLIGCRLHGMGLPEVGQDVLLKAAEVELFGRIVWKGDGERGVKFDEPISETELEHLREVLSRHLGIEAPRTEIIPPEGRRKRPT